MKSITKSGFTLKIKLRKRQKAPIRNVDFGQKVVIAVVIEIHLNIIIAHAEPEMFQGIPLDGCQKIN
jgi:hypothetical protein